jgi:plastocyanin
LVVGRVIYRGSVPAPIQVQVDRDNEVCGQVAMITTLSVDPATHGVRNAIVHIGLGSETVDDVPVQVSVVENKHCAFYPRVAALRAGGETQISNADPVMHNTNMTINSRTVLNVALVAGGTPIRKPLKKEGLHLIKCNVHKFMQAYRYVFSDPFFDQTNETGQFRIMGLPPGLHAMSVWHETLGVLHKEIQVPARGTVAVDFEFK